MINSVQRYYDKLNGGKVIAVQEFTLADGAYTRNLAVIEKVKDTPKKYPRKAGLPSKEPLS